ncbi:MAG: hypothetical protein KDA75_22770, partial [Planctomycetaceae bacterium]|nr:hypothetical protein [Planctomycetaceae bacterium]
MPFFLALISAIPFGVVTLLCVAASDTVATGEGRPVRGRVIVLCGVLVLLAASLLVAGAVAALAIIPRLNDDQVWFVAGCAVGVTVLTPLGLLLIDLGQHVKGRSGWFERRLSRRALRTILTVSGYLLCGLAPLFFVFFFNV